MTNLLQSLDHPSAQAISYSFLQKYYHTLTTSAASVPLFYAHNHSFSFKDLISNESTGKLNEFLENVQFDKVVLANVEVLPLYGRGILIKAAGDLINDASLTQFEQVFVLLPEKIGGLTVYFILNDAISFVATKPVEVEAEIPVYEPDLVIPEEIKNAPKVDEKVAAEAELVDIGPVSDGISTEEPKATVNVKPTSYASAVFTAAKSMASKFGSSTTNAPRKPLSKPKDETKEIPSSIKKEKPDAQQVMENSLCVKKIPDNATEEDVKNAFSSQGEIKSVFMNKVGKIAYVEFTTDEPVKKLLAVDVKERKITINGTACELWKKQFPPANKFSKFNKK